MAGERTRGKRKLGGRRDTLERTTNLAVASGNLPLAGEARNFPEASRLARALASGRPPERASGPFHPDQAERFRLKPWHVLVENFFK
jgi:hypothetical protein